MAPLFGFLSPIIGKVLDLIPDPKQRADQMQALINACEEWDNQQVQIAIEEAKNDNIFVSGARPFILWVCGFAFAYKFVLQPFIIFVLVASHSDFNYKLLPVLDWSEMSSVLMGMLGLGGLKTFERIKGF